MHRIRQIVLIDRENATARSTRPPKGRRLLRARKPLAGKAGPGSWPRSVSVEAGAILTERALRLFDPGETPRACSKGVIVGAKAPRRSKSPVW